MPALPVAVPLGPPPVRQEGRLEILVVEDSPGHAPLKWLRSLGNPPPVVVGAPTAAEARAILSVWNVDCVVLDLEIPDGEQALIEVIAAAPGVPVIVLTSGDEEALDLRLLHLGAQDSVPKGVGDGELLRRSVRYISERARIERLRREVEERFRVAFEQAPIGMALVGLDGHCLKANAALVQLLGRPEAAVLASRLQDLTHPDDLPESEAQAERLLRGEADSYQIEERYLRPDGEVVWVRAGVSVVRGADRRPAYFITQVEDLRDRRRTEEELLYRTLHDPLTGLANRRLLLQRLEESLDRATRSGRRVAVLYCDLDHFRQVNERLGHAGGDRLLVSVAGVLREALRPGDTVGRIGGDEFVMVCEDVTGVAEAGALAERLLSRLRTLPATGATASIGIALGTPGSDPASLLSRADVALFRAKRHGRDRVQIDDNSGSEGGK